MGVGLTVASECLQRLACVLAVQVPDHDGCVIAATSRNIREQRVIKNVVDSGNMTNKGLGWISVSRDDIK